LHAPDLTFNLLLINEGKNKQEWGSGPQGRGEKEREINADK
jgi:hypothetical protein